ncbi:MAG: GNAT family N-acetyltransferase [Dehalococcoidia bacterium]|nr:GNAT family N-acetyltransferase [Dehalococcoidia bacterium]
MKSQEPKLPQLKMRLDKFDSLPEVKLPERYQLTTLRDTGSGDWIQALNATGQLGQWDHNRARIWLEGERHAIEAGTIIITFEGRPVATTCTIPPTSAEPRSELGWVSVSPEHQGQRLGYQVCLAVLHFAWEMGYPGICLNTDDWRLPAIKTYLNLHFEPEMIHDSHPLRWKAVYEKLGVVEDL